MERWEVKLVCGIFMWISLLACFLLPLKVSDFFYRQGARGQHYLDVLTCFAGGVFLACYLLYMAPEVRFLVDENLLKPNNINYPIPELLIACGFFLLLFLERIVATFHHGNDVSKETDTSSTSSSEDAIEGEHDEKRPLLGSVDVTPKSNDVIKEDRPVNETRAVIFYLAMSLDSLFEGMAIGLQRTSYQVIAIFIGIIAHEVVITFCLGLQVTNSLKGKTKPILLFGFFYALMNPLGLLITAIMYETSESSPGLELANGIVQALAAGVFIYVTFYECLEGQIEGKTPWSKLFAILIGFGAMAGFAAIPKEGDGGPQTDIAVNMTLLRGTSP